MRSSDLYQIALIATGALAVLLFSFFLYREVFPEYKIYQEDYVALEKFRSTYTGEEVPAFKYDVKQIVIEREDKGPPVIDRCISCHVALDLQHFSPTKLAKDVNGQMLLDEAGNPVHVPNEDYVWLKLDQKIAELTDEKVNEQLKQQGKDAEIKNRLELAETYKKLKTADVGDHVYDVTKVLRMHPLIGKETRPFEFHPVDHYGCVSCHNGNGRGLTTEKAHGPVFDGEYHVENVGPKPKFTETDAANDPEFSRIFNSKPGHELLFQTTPIFVGSLIEAKCVQCHQSSSASLQGTLNSAGVIAEHKSRDSNSIRKAFENEKDALSALLQIRKSILQNGVKATLIEWKKRSTDYTLPSAELDHLEAQVHFIEKSVGPGFIESPQENQKLIQIIDTQINEMTGSADLTQKLLALDAKATNVIDQFLKENQDNGSKGSLFLKASAWDIEQKMQEHISETQSSLSETLNDQQFQTSIKSDIDKLTSRFHQGENLYISQACYACHRISGFARGGVGPELTKIGNNYPWYIKESIVWPQADLHSSTMPNYRLDHQELENLMTFLLAQKGESPAVSGANYQIMVQEWEAGKKQAWEKPVSPAQMHDLRFGMTVFATQGCAACHRLKGFQSDVGFSVEINAEKPDFDVVYKEKQWFEKMFPESISGSELASIIDKSSAEIDAHINDHVRKDSILEQIEKEYPDTIESYYTNFRFASRAKDAEYKQLIANEHDESKKQNLEADHQAWKNRVHRVLMMYIQEYGLGRLVGPRPNWTGIYRTDEWLMEHFHNPSAFVARSIMPVFPFDDSKFFALTYMLDTLAIRNRNEVREIWDHKGFNPEIAYNIHCAQCHGNYLQGNGPVAEWIYPIPKNLTNSEFLRNLTKERVIQSITHGVKGTPMPPWGEIGGNKPGVDGIPELTKQEIAELANWIFASLTGGQVIKDSEDVPKWQYSPEDVIKELKKEGNTLPSQPEQDKPTSDVSYRKRKRETVLAMADAPSEGKKETQASSASTEVSELFDVRESPVPGPDKYGYYIKKKYYTSANIDQGREFFEINCAACHGKEGDGSGIRSEVMLDAKPRALTNLDWINTRDDLRLLRSIKYGVAGTAMTPWGDFTSSLQRLQLVMFIRSLSEDTQEHAQLRDALYETFQKDQIAVENARIKEFQSLESLQKEYSLAKLKTQQASIGVEVGKETPAQAAAVFEQELTAGTKVAHQKAIDEVYTQIKTKIRQESELYQNVGMALINSKFGDDVNADFVKLIKLSANRFSIDEKGMLHINHIPEEQISGIKNTIVQQIDKKIAALDLKKSDEDSKTKAEMTALLKLKKEVIGNLEEAVRLRQQEARLFDQLKM